MVTQSCCCAGSLQEETEATVEKAKQQTGTVNFVSDAENRRQLPVRTPEYREGGVKNRTVPHPAPVSKKRRVPRRSGLGFCPPEEWTGSDGITTPHLLHCEPLGWLHHNVVLKNVVTREAQASATKRRQLIEVYQDCKVADFTHRQTPLKCRKCHTPRLTHVLIQQ